MQDTDRCVMCGLCLPHCPTYRLSGDEGDSPRGRVALIHGLDSGELPVSPKLLGHLDRCLECGACEAMCPSRVPFGRLMDGARARVEPDRPRATRQARLRQRGLALLRDPDRLQRSGRWLRLYQRSGLQWLARLAGLPAALGLGRADAMLPRLRPVRRPYPAAADADRPAVQLFRGCIQPLVDGVSESAAIAVLEALGFRVEIPAGQGCCGAVHQHDGEPGMAGQLAARNREAFGPGDRPVISLASGCSAHLGTTGLGDRVRDITGFLADTPWPEELAARPLAATVAVHIPCTARNHLREADAAARLLKHIPGLQLQTVTDTGQCCGAAGTYFLTQPEIADRLRDERIEAIRASGASILVSHNIGCSLHLAAGLRVAGMKMEVLHPVTLLARQLGLSA